MTFKARPCKSLQHLAWTLGFLPGGGQLPRHEATQAATWGDPHGEELGPPDKSQQQFNSQVSEPPWKWILLPQPSLQMTAAPADA